MCFIERNIFVNINQCSWLLLFHLTQNIPSCMSALIQLMIFIFHSGLCRYNNHLSCREPSPSPKSLRPPPLSVRSQPNRFGRLAGTISDFTAVIFHFSARQEKRAGWQFGCERQRDNQQVTTNGGAGHIFKWRPLPNMHKHTHMLENKMETYLPLLEHLLSVKAKLDVSVTLPQYNYVS